MSALVRVITIKALMRVDTKERYLNGAITTELVITASYSFTISHTRTHTHTHTITVVRYLLQLHIPVVQSDRPHFRDVYPEAAVYPRALDAEHDTKVDASPLGLPGATICTLVIAQHIQEVKA